MPAPASSNIFKPLQIGRCKLAHRVILAPLTRYRADIKHVHTPLATEYYGQRSRIPGSFLITEATFISPQAGGQPNVPGIWNDAQIKAWKEITDKVHSQGSFIYLQLWNLGRVATPDELKKDGCDLVSAGDLPFEDGAPKPRPLTKDEIKSHVEDFRSAARNAVHKSNFDGVEIHGANGYLVDQFIQSVSNNRTDEYGGSVENRARFCLEIVDAVVAEVGADRTGIRFSPFGQFQGMREPEPLEPFLYIVKRLKSKYPDLAYVHVVNPTVQGSSDVETLVKSDSVQPLYDIWAPGTFLSAGGYNAETGWKAADEKDCGIVYGRWFTSNPDLPLKLRYGKELKAYNRETFYLYGPEHSEGYITDQPDPELVGKTM